MRSIECEAVRDLLPDAEAGRLDAGVDGALRRHLEACESCRAEAEIVAALEAGAPAVTAALATRVRAALEAELRGARPAVCPRLEVVPGAKSARRVPRAGAWRGLRRWGLPASLAAAALAGVVVWRSTAGTGDIVGADGGLASGDAAAAAPLPEWPASRGIVAGAAVLDDLSDAQLERLLTEIES